MHHTPSRDLQDNPLRTARAAVLNGQRIPLWAQAQLEAQGVDVPALEYRLIHSQEFTL